MGEIEVQRVFNGYAFLHSQAFLNRWLLFIVVKPFEQKILMKLWALRGWLELDAPSRRKNGRTAFWKGTMVCDWAPSSDGRKTCICVCRGCFPMSSFGYTYDEAFQEHVTYEMWFGFASTSTFIIRRDSCMQAVRLGGGSIDQQPTTRHYTIPPYTQKLLVSVWWNPASDFQAWHRWCRGLLPSILWAIRGCRLPLGHHHWPSSSHWL